MSDQESLLSFGFSEAKVRRALKATSNAGLQQALDWLEKHADDGDDDDNAEVKPDDGDDAAKDVGTQADPGEAKSLRCMDCGKMFRNHALASYHGEKSGHENFEESTDEIKPLTADEKDEKLKELRERMQEKKKLQAKKDAEEAKANEAIRRKAGKDQGAAKADLALKEAEKDALQRKRDKIDEAKAKAAVRAQIEADKRARAEKAAREKALRGGRTPDIAQEVAAPPKAAPSTTGVKKDYDSTRLQIRLPSGSAPLITSMPSSASLRDVETWVKKQTAGQALGPFAFSIPFPRKTFGASEMGQSLQALGLAPSAVLIVS